MIQVNTALTVRLLTFDGTDYIITNPDSLSGPTTRLLVFDSAGNYIKTEALSGKPAGSPFRLLEDLSSLGNIPQNTVPEPATFMLFGAGLVGLIAIRARSRKA